MSKPQPKKDLLLDQELVKLIQKRLKVSMELKELNRRCRQPLLTPQRQRQILTKVHKVSDPEKEEYIRFLIQEILKDGKLSS